MPSLFRPTAQPKDGPARTSPVWHIRYFCPIRRRSHAISTGCRNRKNAERLLRQFCDLLESNRVGLDNPLLKLRDECRQQAAGERQDVEEALAAFESDLRAGRIRKRGNRRPVGKEHADSTMARIRKVISESGVKTVDAITVSGVNAYLDRCREQGVIRTNQTRKHFERAIKSFSRWLATTERLDKDPLAALDVTFVNPELDVVHSRSEFTMAEVNAIIAAATENPTTVAGFSGKTRAVLYLTASVTGYRARELAALTRQDFAPDFSSVTLSGQFTKNAKRATTPIPATVRPVLAEFTATLAPTDHLWPGGWKKDGEKWVATGWIRDRRGADFLRADAAKVGIVIGRKGKAANGGRVLDFHSFRHFYISNLDRSDAGDGLKGELARATPGVAERYTHRDLTRLAAVVERLPVPDLTALTKKPSST